MSDSRIDLAKYMPSIEASLAVADEAAAEERVRRALADPALEVLKVEPTAQRPPSNPSPWASAPQAPIEIDKTALPSAAAPTNGGTLPAPRGRKWTQGRTFALAIAAAFLPAMIVLLLFVKPAQPTAAVASAAASMPVTGPVTTVAAAPPLTSSATNAADPVPTQSPRAPAANPARSAKPSATVPPSPAPSATPSAPAAPASSLPKIIN
jgi:hypothetical protein